MGKVTWARIHGAYRLWFGTTGGEFGIPWGSPFRTRKRYCGLPWHTLFPPEYTARAAAAGNVIANECRFHAQRCWS